METINSMKDLIVSVCGEYAPVLTAEGDPLYGLDAIDWAWLAGAILLIVFVSCVLRIINSAVNRL